jgi:DNA-binding protein HU-beta
MNLWTGYALDGTTSMIKERKMKKDDLIQLMAEGAGITKVQAAKALNSVIDGISEALKEEDGKISLIGFGTFLKVHRKARQGVNPATGAKIQIEATDVIRFKVGKKLKDAVA